MSCSCSANSDEGAWRSKTMMLSGVFFFRIYTTLHQYCKTSISDRGSSKTGDTLFLRRNFKIIVHMMYRTTEF